MSEGIDVLASGEGIGRSKQWCSEGATFLHGVGLQRLIVVKKTNTQISRNRNELSFLGCVLMTRFGFCERQEKEAENTRRNKYGSRKQRSDRYDDDSLF